VRAIADDINNVAEPITIHPSAISGSLADIAYGLLQTCRPGLTSGAG
jgi:hypothetical protein